MSDSATPTHPDPPVTIRLAEEGDALVILDQTALPERRVERVLETVEEVEEAIQALRVRGAPLIGITAALGIAAMAAGWVRSGESRDPASGGPEALARQVRAWSRRLARARPTAVNLAWALERMERRLDGALEGLEPSGAPASTRGAAAVARELRHEAEAILAQDREMCRRIGTHALTLLEGHQDPDRPTTLLTHCNAGALATGGIGTALAPIYLGHAAGLSLRVFADETRPLLQGSRLTAWELEQAGIDVTVLSDGMAGALMSTDPPDAILVGADRIAANGDVANKIGTYGLAVLARHHGVPFHVLAPTSTVDLATPTGTDIPIEHRDPEEIRRGFGRLTTPAETRVWSPAFDVTPAELVTSIVTEQGVVKPPFGPGLREAVEAARRENPEPGPAPGPAPKPER
jgi:methylthioribose-1-phosphate isomerase